MKYVIASGRFVDFAALNQSIFIGIFIFVAGVSVIHFSYKYPDSQEGAWLWFWSGI